MKLFGFLPTVRIAEKSFQEAATEHVHNLRDLVHCRTLVAVAERFRGVGCSLVTPCAASTSEYPVLLLAA
jgi:hypothetical protein